ncbi:MAG: hypothetical protein ACLUQ6_03445 [Alistipes onderdonkii]
MNTKKYLKYSFLPLVLMLGGLSIHGLHRRHRGRQACRRRGIRRREARRRHVARRDVETRTSR